MIYTLNLLKPKDFRAKKLNEWKKNGQTIKPPEGTHIDDH